MSKSSFALYGKRSVFIWLCVLSSMLLVSEEALALKINTPTDKRFYHLSGTRAKSAKVVKVAKKAPNFHSLDTYNNVRRVKSPRPSAGILITRGKKNTRQHQQGEYRWPVEEGVKQHISSGFGYRTHPVTGKWSFHQGIDIAAPLGSRVLASVGGKVIEAATHSRLGKYIKIEHEDGSHALYGHLHRWEVNEGDAVDAGEVIGRVGSTGRSTGPHLDFSLRVGDKAIDPLSKLQKPEFLAQQREQNSIKLSALR